MNEKINSRMEFPFTINLYDFTREGVMEAEKAAASKKQAETDAGAAEGEEGKQGGDGSDGKAADEEEEDSAEKDSSDDQASDGHENCIYDLVGILCHSGTANSGHYFSYIKDRSTGKWHEYNDSVVQAFNLKDIESKCFGSDSESSSSYDTFRGNAYMCIYERRSAHVYADSTGIVNAMSLNAGSPSSSESQAPTPETATEDAKDEEATAFLKKLRSVVDEGAGRTEVLEQAIPPRFFREVR